jgi:hypothetical protein
MANFLCGTTILYATSKLSLTPPLANQGYSPDDIRIMTDESDSWNLPTKENIVSNLCKMLIPPSLFIQLQAMDALVRDAQPHDTFFLYCACSHN